MFVVPELIGYLGNQMSIISAAISFALRTGKKYHIPSKTGNSFPSYFNHLENKEYKPGTFCVYNEPYFHYKEINIKCDGNTMLRGYFQSEKYWQQYSTEVKKAFGFKYEKNKGTIAVQVRRGDFLNYPTKHPVITEDYLLKSLDTIYDITKMAWKIMIFSNDISWCKEYFGRVCPLMPDRISYCELNDQKKEMELMMGCEHIIGSNSTFSLWGYWLNENPYKIGIFPEKWFGEDYSDKNTNDLYPEGVIKL